MNRSLIRAASVLPAGPEKGVFPWGALPPSGSPVEPSPLLAKRHQRGSPAVIGTPPPLHLHRPRQAKKPPGWTMQGEVSSHVSFHKSALTRCNRTPHVCECVCVWELLTLCLGSLEGPSPLPPESSPCMLLFEMGEGGGSWALWVLPWEADGGFWDWQEEATLPGQAVRPSSVASRESEMQQREGKQHFEISRRRVFRKLHRRVSSPLQQGSSLAWPVRGVIWVSLLQQIQPRGRSLGRAWLASLHPRSVCALQACRWWVQREHNENGPVERK